MNCFVQETQAQDLIDLVVCDPARLSDWLDDANGYQKQWVQSHQFNAEPGSVLAVPNTHGEIDVVLVGVSAVANPLWALAGLPARLPRGDYKIVSHWSDANEQLALMGFGLACYRFDRYKSQRQPEARLLVKDEWADELEVLLEASYLARDIVNTPANDMGPKELSSLAQSLAEAHGGTFHEVMGLELEEKFPAIHTVGQASSRDPRLITLKWGREDAPSLALVGKGVIFDSGGLSIKPNAGMVLMKKDLGGAAHALALAKVIMSKGLDVHLRVYIPAVENAIAGNAYRPSDIIKTRKGTTVEVGNTDAEGRVVLADALTLASEEGADRIVDFATLTGAARVALGEDLPPIYGRDLATVREIQDLSFELGDPLWPMPLFEGYREQIRPPYADLSNTGQSPMGGSVTAALFLDHFVAPEIDWYHLDIYAWNMSDRPGRPVGGEAQGIRAIWAWLKKQYA